MSELAWGILALVCAAFFLYATFVGFGKKK